MVAELLILAHFVVLVGCDVSVGIARRAGYIDDGTLADAVGTEVGLSCLLAFRPLASRAVVRKEEHKCSSRYNEDTWNDKGDSPCSVRSQATLDKAVENGRHGEVGDTASRVAKTTSDGISGADDVLVEESSAPYLAGDE